MATKNYSTVSEYQCKVCGEVKAIENFRKKKDSRTRHSHVCKSCQCSRDSSPSNPGDRRSERCRPYYVLREVLESGRVIVKFGDQRPPNASPEHRHGPVPGTASSLVLFESY